MAKKQRLKQAVIGMAKSNLNINKGGQGRSAELDFLRLAFAKYKLETEKKYQQVHCYFVLLNIDNKSKVEKWNKKYQTSIHCFFANDPKLSVKRKIKNFDNRYKEVLEEKDKNMDPIAETRDAKARIGEKFCEEILRKIILLRHKRLKEIEKVSKESFEIAWDYFGVIE